MPHTERYNAVIVTFVDSAPSKLVKRKNGVSRCHEPYTYSTNLTILQYFMTYS